MSVALWLAVAHAATLTVAPGGDLWGTIAKAAPGDEVVVSAGTWSSQQGSGSWYRRVELLGTEVAPIVVRAADGARPILEGDPAGSQNLVNLAGRYFTWRGFEMRGGSHGLRLESSAHVVLEDLEIHDVADVGLSMNIPGSTYEAITVRRVEIHDTAGDAGECMYLGCNDDGCQVFDSVIEFNWCHDTLAAGQGDGIELKTGSYDNTIRHNVIHDVHYPGITVYGTRGRGTNEVYGNVVWNSGDNGIQTVGDAFVHDNLVFASAGNGIASKPSQGEVPNHLRIVHNTVVGAGDACLRGNEWAATTDVVVANNALFCAGANAIKLPQGRGDVVFLANAVAGADDAGVGSFAADLARDLTDAAALDAWPAPGSALIAAADVGWATIDDFDGRRRTGAPDVGAYEAGGARGWAVGPGFKVLVEDADADTDSDSDTDTDTAADTDAPPDTDVAAGACGCAGAPRGAGLAGVLAMALFARRRRGPAAFSPIRPTEGARAPTRA